MSQRPDWLKVRIPSGDAFFEVRDIIRSHKLNTVCEDAMCPNIAECWGQHRTATFMILGDICTRSCRFCDVTTGRPLPADPDEPRRVAEMLARLSLEHTVITCVDRDALGGFRRNDRVYGRDQALMTMVSAMRSCTVRRDSLNIIRESTKEYREPMSGMSVRKVLKT